MLSADMPQKWAEEKEFWDELNGAIESIPRGHRVVLIADFNGHVRVGDRGDKEVTDRIGVKDRNVEGQAVVDFANRMEMAMVNNYFQKREEQRVTYKSGGRCTQLDSILCRRGNFRDIKDCKVVAGESVAKLHGMVVCKIMMEMRKKKSMKTVQEMSELTYEQKFKFLTLRRMRSVSGSLQGRLRGSFQRSFLPTLCQTALSKSNSSFIEQDQHK